MAKTPTHHLNIHLAKSDVKNPLDLLRHPESALGSSLYFCVNA